MLGLQTDVLVFVSDIHSIFLGFILENKILGTKYRTYPKLVGEQCFLDENCHPRNQGHPGRVSSCRSDDDD